MSSNQQELIDELFEKAVQLGEDARSDFLNRECAGLSVEVRRQLEALLEADSTTQTRPFMQAARMNLAEMLPSSLPVDEMIGKRIGPYEIKKKIAVGGFGKVYLGTRDDEFLQKVAIKLMRSDFGEHDSFVRRFEIERQVLSDLNHPYIARLIDGGRIEDGRPYFVMEFVDGQAITDYVETHQLDMEACLRLFQKVCEAVAYAHQFGVVHRDIKPSNILVSNDEHPVLLDFGIAKLTDLRSQRRLVAITETGQLPLTPEYASPEQLKGDLAGQTSDIYSLGVVLFEMLTGSRPFSMSSQSQHEYIQTVSTQPPPKPSTSISKSHRESNFRNSRQVRKKLVGDIDNIVLMALRKEPDRRYQSANHFAEDIQRYFERLPVLARPDSPIYRLGKFTQRNRAAILSGCLMLIASIAVLIGLSMSMLTEAQLKTERRQRQLIAKLTQLTSEVRTWRTAKPEKAILLAAEAVEYSRKNDNLLLPLAHETLLNSVSSLAGYTLPKSESELLQFALNRRWFVGLTKEDSAVKLWDLEADNPFAAVPYYLHDKETSFFSTSRQGNRLVTAGDGVQVWKLDSDIPQLWAELTTLSHHNSRLHLSPNGHWLAIGAKQGRIIRWDLRSLPATSLEVGSLTGEASEIFISNDGRWIAIRESISGLNKQKIFARSLIDVEKMMTHRLDEHLSATDDLALRTISPNSRWLVTEEGRVFDLRAENPCTTFASLNDPFITAATFSADSSELYTAIHFEPGVKRWNLGKFFQSPSYQPEILPTKDGVVDIAVSTEGNRLVAAMLNGAYCWDLAEEPTPQTPTMLRHGNTSTIIAISPEGKWIAVGRNAPRLWDARLSNYHQSRLILHREPGIWNWAGAVSSDGRWIATSSGNGRDVEIWDTHVNGEGTFPEKQKRFSGFDSKVVKLMTSFDDRWLAAVGERGSVKLFDLHHPQLAAVDLRKPVTTKFSPVATCIDDRLFVSGSQGNIYQWNLTNVNRNEMRYFARYSGSNLFGMAVAPNGTRLATASSEGVRVWNLNQLSRPPVTLLPIQKEWVARRHLIDFSEDGRWLVHAANSVRVWDLDSTNDEYSAQELWNEEGNGGIWQLAMSLDARWLYATRFDGTARLWDLSYAPPVPRDLSSAVQSAAISNDSRWLATTHRHGQVQLWDLNADDLESATLVLTGHDGPVWRALFSGDSKWLITFGGDGTIRRWMLDVDELVEYARRIAGRRLSADEKKQFGIE